MKRFRQTCTALIALWASAVAARADISYLTQARSITAATSFDANSQTISAPDFGAFLASLNLWTEFPTDGGGTGVNSADAGIDCHLDPNAIIVNGSLAGAGGISVGGNPGTQTGEAAARIDVTFALAETSPFRLMASPRPDHHPGDRFKIKLEDLTNGGVVFFIDDTMPPQAVDVLGSLGAGSYSLEYQVELTVDGPEVLRDFFFSLTVPAPSAGLALALGGLGALRRRR